MAKNFRFSIPAVSSLSELASYAKKANIKVIIFGETHGFIDDLAFIDIILTTLKPSNILYELLENISIGKNYTSIIDKKPSEHFSLISSYGDLQAIVSLAKKHALPISGCDLPSLGRTEPIPLELTPEIELFEKELLASREAHHKKVVLSTHPWPVFVIVGSYHLRDNAPLRSIPNALFFLPFARGEIQFGQTGNLEKNEIIIEVISTSSI